MGFTCSQCTGRLARASHRDVFGPAFRRGDVPLPQAGGTDIGERSRTLSGSDQENLMEVTGRSAESLEILARALHVKNAELQPTLEAIASTAVTMLSPARYAGLTILSRGELIPRATTGEPPLLLDRLQQRLGDGPCVHAATHQSVIRIEDTEADERWPAFCPEAARLNVRSMLCVPLWVDERGLGALSLYADQAAAFSELHERVTVLLATFAALALAEAQRADQMHDALGNRDTIGQAKGILMERHALSADAAFGVLSRVSQAENVKLADIAGRLVETGGLPGVPGSEAAGAVP
jgi:GAF domain-containing protein